LRLILTILLVGQVCLHAEQPDQPGSSTEWASDRFWLSGQANFIEQFHAPFRSPYSGPNSLRATSENALSRVLTLYTGVRLAPGLEFLFDVESAGGQGVSDALGLGGFTNLDVVRNPSLGSAPYVARIMLHKTFALSPERVEANRRPLSLASSLPARRLEVRFGKFSTADFFDINSIGSDSHLQFMNWTTDNNGAYDYAADTRGYSYGALFEYYDRR
jgi:high affinity Mn2+ porin